MKPAKKRKLAKLEKRIRRKAIRYIIVQIGGKMRKIKFRAWNKRYKSFTFFNLKNLNDNDFKFTNWDNLILMQYTGLKDKSGNDIYEGDIVKDHISIYAIEDIRFLDKYSDLFYMNGASHIIIGNIYENKDLI